MMELLEVRLYVDGDTVLSERPPLLDALLAWAICHRAKVYRSDRCREMIRELPLARHADPDEESRWCWKASWLRYRVQGMPRTVRLHRHATEMKLHEIASQLNKPRKNYHESQGPFRSYDMRVSVAHVVEARGWCVGDRQEVADLVKRVRFLGPLRRLGFGRVRSTEVDTVAPERCPWFYRPMPTAVDAEGATWVPGTQPLSPPYWDRARTRRVVFPVDPPPSFTNESPKEVWL